MSRVPNYNGKPTAYLDQNILDLFVDHGLGDFGQSLMAKFQVVYSDETLKEIKRSVGYESKFLAILKELNAFHLKLVLEQPGFIATDNASITNKDPYQAFSEYCDDDTSILSLEDSMNQWIFKFSGGRQGETFNEIYAEQKLAFFKLMDSIVIGSDDLPEDQQKQVLQYSNSMKAQIVETLDQLESTTASEIPNQENWHGIRQFREQASIGPKELNNIQPPNVLEKIWHLYTSVNSKSDSATDIETFFNLKTHPLNPNQSYFKHQKVTGIYNMLNTIGYYPDSNLHKERRFIAALSDNSHASMASFCNLLLSRDKNFVKKVQAAYEFLAISTEVHFVEVKIT